MIRTIEGFIENGAIRLRDDVALPENARVIVIISDQGEPEVAHVMSPRPT